MHVIASQLVTCKGQEPSNQTKQPQIQDTWLNHMGISNFCNSGEKA